MNAQLNIMAMLSPRAGGADPKHGIRYLTRATGVFLAFLSLSAAAPPQAEPKCSITYSANPEMTELIDRRGFAFDGYGRLCRVLAANGLKLRINSKNGVLVQRAYGWVFVTFERETTGVKGTVYHSSVSISDIPNTPEAALAMYDTLNSALASMAERPEDYVSSVIQEEARLRRVLAVKR